MKARGREKKQETAAPQARATGQGSRDLADFSNEYSGLRLSINVEGLGEIQGWILRGSPYWFKILTDNGVIYVNKAYVISVKPLELTPPAQRAAVQEG